MKTIFLKLLLAILILTVIVSGFFCWSFTVLPAIGLLFVAGIAFTFVCIIADKLKIV
jgi:hypothetical protein